MESIVGMATFTCITLILGRIYGSLVISTSKIQKSASIDFLQYLDVCIQTLPNVVFLVTLYFEFKIMNFVYFTDQNMKILIKNAHFVVYFR